MRTDRWLKNIGLVIILAMLVSAAFSLGVYVGKHGWARTGLGYQPGRNAPPPADPKPRELNPSPDGKQSQQNQPGPPPGPPQIIGRLRAVREDLLVLNTPDGIREITFTPETRFIKHTGDTLSFEDLKMGEIYGVFGRLIPDDGGSFQADILILLPPKP